MPDDTRPLSRRDLLKSATAAGAGLALTGLGPDLAASSPVTRHASPGSSHESRVTGLATMAGVPFDRHETVRIGIVGTGLRGKSLLNEWLAVDGVRITALCDIVPEKVEQARQMMRRAGHDYEPAVFTRGERDFENLCRRDDVDLVYTATPWDWHVPVCVAAMEHGKHAATEVPAATTIADCWTLVNLSERTRRHCLLMENCNYGYNELLVLSMVRAGVFGEIKAGGAAYNHDLRAILWETKDEGLWRRDAHTKRNGNLYPTHGLGPVAFYMDVNRGDRLEYLVSMSTGEFGLTEWRAAHEPRASVRWRERYVCGDLNRSLVRTARGRVILLEHDVTSPRPYSRINSVQGTKGIFEDYPPRLYVDGPGANHRWQPIDGYRQAYEHPLWSTLGERARSGGHGGMDYVMAWRLVQCMREGLPPDIDVYDAAAWSAPGPLSEQSVANNGRPAEFPDFTRGVWQAARRVL
ncbi:MAG TPA: Gfo/Idh/MocA family oxidoreductase [Gemmatimonadaceae bacterium]|nr:Gfo/Idh/MocA family oxidoreductase [Gemmatimonadaceae bacterium]